MIVAQAVDGRIQVVDRIKEMVRLADGLNEKGELNPDAIECALACLERFGQRLKPLHRDNVRVVGTNTLRRARRHRKFLEQAQAVLGHPVEIISGGEEARLIYLGVSHALEDNHDRRLVIDIGGGSTELILGRRFEPELMESLHMGCVSWSRQFFDDGAITAEAFKAATAQASVELEPIERRYRSAGWDTVIGASGTILSVQSALRELTGTETVTPAGINRLRKTILKIGNVHDIELTGVAQERRDVFPGGLAVLAAILDALGIDELYATNGALREGLLQDLLGRRQYEDTREITVHGLTTRFHIDTSHARRVRETALSLLAQVAEVWDLQGSSDRLTLAWAADLHEIGMDISHSQYHKHGEYLLANLEMSGFSRSEQTRPAACVRSHRRKLPANAELFPALKDERLMRLILLLRLAVVLHRGRSPAPMPHVKMHAKTHQMILGPPKEWLDERPLTQLDLKDEAGYLQAIGMALKIRPD